MPVRPSERQRRAEVEVAQLAVLVDPQDEADRVVVEVELALVGAGLDGHGIACRVHVQR
jgi:hypothetical protein